MIKPSIILLFVSFFFCICINAQTGNYGGIAKNSNGPQFELINTDSDYILDVRRNAKFVREIRFKNSGRKELVIKDAYSTLSGPRSKLEIVEVKWPENPVKPGKRGAIMFTCVSKDDPGSFEGDLFVVSNASDTDLALIHISGVVKLLSKRFVNRRTKPYDYPLMEGLYHIK